MKINLIKSAEKPEMCIVALDFFVSFYQNPASWHPCQTGDEYKVMLFIPCLSGRSCSYHQIDKSMKALMETVLFGKRTRSF